MLSSIMSGAVTVLFNKLLGLLHSILVGFRRLLCCFRRMRSNDADVLPFTVVTDAGRSRTLASHGNEANDSAFVNWNTWDSNLTADPAIPRRQPLANVFLGPTSTQDDVPVEPEPNFFEDMTPDMRRSKKIVVRSSRNSEDVQPSSPVNRFAFNAYATTIPDTSSELGELEETRRTGDAWEVEANDVDPDAVLKAARQRERELRLQQHAQRRVDRTHQQSTASQLGVKIS